MVRKLCSRRMFTALTLTASFLLLGVAPAQERGGNHGNWKLADKFTPEFLRQFIYDSAVVPGWINNADRFWYRWRDSEGARFMLVDCAARTKKPLFDSAKMAAQLSEAVKKPFDVNNLPITTLTFNREGNAITFTVEGKRLEYNLEKETLKDLGPATPPQPASAPGAPATVQTGTGTRTNTQQRQLNNEQQQQLQQRLEQLRQQRGQQGGAQAPPTVTPGDYRTFSPDRQSYVFAMNHNLYLVHMDDEKNPIQLSHDGERYYSFAGGAGFGGGQFFQQQQQQQQQQQLTDEERQRQQEQLQQQVQQTQQQGEQDRPGQRLRASVTWAPDSSAFYITRSDSRKVKELYLVNALAEPRPTLTSYKYAMPAEPDVAQTELWVYRGNLGGLSRLKIEKWKDQRLMNIAWDGGGDQLRFVRRDRLQRNLDFCEYDFAGNQCSVLFNESVESAFLETQPPRYVKEGGDFLWWSERSGWGHYYLYSHDGKCKNAVTSGPWRAETIVALDADKGKVWVAGVGREKGENPYYRHTYCVGLDGAGLSLLDPGDATHNTILGPSRKYGVDNCSRVDGAPKSLLRDEKGVVVMQLEEQDLRRLHEAGWKMPETFKVKAADGVTDIYGNLYKPFDFDPNKKYPIIAHVYPGPQTEQVSYTFSAIATPQRLAQLGFIVIQIGNRGGSPQRSNAYHSYGYFNLRDYGLADKKAGIEQLAARYPWIDIDRVGIFGHSGGGFMTAAALLLPPYNEFFKVGVSSAGNHDNNIYNANWSEQHHGLKEVKVPVKKPTTTAATAATGTTTTTSTTDKKDETPPPGPPPGAAGQTQQQQQQKTEEKKDEKKEEVEYETKFEIKVPANHELAANLKGKLLLVHGDMDTNVHPGGTIRLVNALIKSNKRFDLMMLPGKAHGFADMQPYFTQMMFEYFAEHLLGDYYRGSAELGRK